MRVAITGASGFLGGALAKAYRRRGDDVVAFVRQSSNVSQLQKLGVELYYGDITAEDGYHQFLKDADLAIHSAAIASDFGRWEDFQAVNVDSVKHFLNACRSLNTKRAIYISSVVVYGKGINHRGSDEDSPYADIIIDNYTRSKIMADRFALDFYEEHKFPVTVIRPGYIWGSGDRAVMPRLVDAIRRKMLAVVDGGVNLMDLTHIDNLVDGIMLAAENDEAIGKPYNITDGSKVATRQFLTDIIDLIGIEYKMRSYPYVPAYIAAYLCELYARLRKYKVTPPITRYAVRTGKYDQVFDISRAIYQLGYKPKVHYRQGIAALTQYVRSLYYKQK